MDFVDLKTQYAALRETVNARIQRVLDHGQFIMGPEVKELEERLAAYTGAKHCVTCASGTEALLIALMSLDIKPGDEIITTPFTFVATAEVAVLLGAKPVFVDVEADTCNIDASKIEAAITPRTRAIMPVALYGQPADMDEINAVAARHGLAVIEDAAQSFGATYKGSKSCNLSTIGCTSFFPSKPLGCYGDGGALFTNDAGLAQAMRGRMDTLQCAVVLAKLERFEWEVERRINIGRGYSRLLAEVPGIELLHVKEDRTSVYAQYTILAEDRPRMVTALKQAGIPTAIHYPKPLHRQPAYTEYRASGPLEHANYLAGRVLSLPMHPDLDPDTQSVVVAALQQALKAGVR